jgi:hypothetical protein
MLTWVLAAAITIVAMVVWWYFGFSGCDCDPEPLCFVPPRDEQ